MGSRKRQKTIIWHMTGILNHLLIRRSSHFGIGETSGSNFREEAGSFFFLFVFNYCDRIVKIKLCYESILKLKYYIVRKRCLTFEFERIEFIL